MSQNPERASFADALHDAAADFAAPDTMRLHDLAVRRGRQIKRRRAGAAAAGGTVALGMAGVLAFALSATTNHGAAAAANSGTPATGAVEPSPSYTHPAAPPAIRSGGITSSVIQDALEYALPPGAQVMRTGGPADLNTDAEVVDTNTHSWYVQTEVTLKSRGQLGTGVAISVAHTASPDTCATLNQGMGGGVGECTQSTLDGGQLLDDVVPPGVESNSGVFEFLEWFSPTGYETDLQLQDTTLDDFALTKAQADAVLTNQVFTAIAQALPPDACVGGTFSNPVDPPSPGQSPLQHVRCSSDGTLYPTF
jgi:hypothetical protein